jgi:hypothetical protein
VRKWWIDLPVDIDSLSNRSSCLRIALAVTKSLLALSRLIVCSIVKPLMRNEYACEDGVLLHRWISGWTSVDQQSMDQI